MKRRAFLGALAGGLLAAPLAAEAQQPRVYRVGVVLQGGPYLGAVDGLRKGLAELGLEEGKQFILHVRDGKGDLKSVEAAARNLEQEKVELIYAVATYGVSYYEVGRLSARHVQRILLGADPGDLAVEQLDRLHFVINLKTAKVLGLTIPQSRADEVIE